MGINKLPPKLTHHSHYIVYTPYTLRNILRAAANTNTWERALYDTPVVCAPS